MRACHCKCVLRIESVQPLEPGFVRKRMLVSFPLSPNHKVLWPYLIEFLTPPEYTSALGVVCKCVASIGCKKRKVQAEDYMLKFTEQGI